MKTLLLLTGLCCSSLAFAQNDPSATVGDTGTVTFNYRGATKTYTTVRAADGKIWLQQNLGTSAVATAYNDTAGYGDLFQWGRWDDGHQLRTSTTALAGTLPQNNPSGIPNGSPFFYRGPNPSDWWGNGGAGDTWSVNPVSATNGKDPCTAIAPNWRLASEAEWGAILTAENITGRVSAFSSNLKLTTTGQREPNIGNLLNVDLYGNYWTSTSSGPYAKNVTIGDNFINPSDDALRSYGFSLRCITPTCTGVFQPDSIQGSDTVCFNSTQTYTVPATANASATGYTWTVPAGWTIVSGATTNSITVTAGSGGTISVTASNACGTSSVRSMVVAVNPLPAPPVITKNGFMLSTTTYASYSWSKNGTVIPGATNPTYSVTNDGSYTVTVTDSNGCSATSAAYIINTLAVPEALADAIRIYPNPAGSVVHIAASVPVNASVYGMDGRLLLSQSHAKELDIARLQPGTYTLRISNENGVLIKVERLTVVRP